MICPKCNSELFDVGNDVVCVRCGYKRSTIPSSPAFELTAEKQLKINKIAQKKFVSTLYSSAAKEGHQYIEDRGVSEAIIKKFGLGYCGPFGSKLQYSLSSKGFSEDEMIMSGLFGKNKKGKLYEKFFNRAIFPIFNVENQVVGFGGRTLRDKTENGTKIPKYWNSPESEVFHKRENLYALNIAKSSKYDFFILCEGYMDVITLHQAGYDNAVASLGTALTPEQAHLMKRYKNSVYIAYDADAAGIKATQKAIPLLRMAGLNIKIINLCPAKDPDEFIKENGKESLQRRIDKASSFERFLYQNATKDEKCELLAHLLMSLESSKTNSQ